MEAATPGRAQAGQRLARLVLHHKQETKVRQPAAALGESIRNGPKRDYRNYIHPDSEGEARRGEARKKGKKEKSILESSCTC